MYNDKKRAVLWAKEHWHVAGFACGCIVVAAAVLVDLNVLSVRAAIASTVASIVYVLLTTWNFTHDRVADDNQQKAG